MAAGEIRRMTGSGCPSDNRLVVNVRGGKI
jgi:hypothetical protein